MKNLFNDIQILLTCANHGSRMINGSGSNTNQAWFFYTLQNVISVIKNIPTIRKPIIVVNDPVSVAYIISSLVPIIDLKKYF